MYPAVHVEAAERLVCYEDGSDLTSENILTAWNLIDTYAIRVLHQDD